MPRIAWGRVAVVIRLGIAALLLGLAASSPALAQDAVCAQVKIEIKQKLSLERQAFDAVMRINNGLDTSSIQNVGINLTFADEAGNAVIATSDPNNTSAAFFVRIDALTGINAIDGTGAVAPKTTGEIHWLIIPAAGTGGVQPQGKLYFIGASLTYSLLGTTSTVAVTPDFVTVKPQPLLALDYFLAGDVYADDAFTPEIEPPVPFTLGVRIKNVGGGTAAKTSIESAQPKIVENKQGLLIGFQILDSFVNDQPAAPTLLINFGDIGPGAASVGRWNMVTTLSGRFIDLTAGYTHADSLGGALTSLIQGISTHLLVHDVKVDLAGRDNVRDFLALDVDVLRVYESEGVDTLVTDQSANARLQPGGTGKYGLTFQATTGFAYVKLPDPFAGQAQPGAVVRSDGKTLPVENAWLSKTRNANLSWSYFINFFDVNTTGIYTVGLAGSGFASLSGTVFADANNNGAQDSGETGLGAIAVTLSGVDDQGASVNTTGFTIQGGTWSFVQLRPGTYSVKVAAVSGYVDGKSASGTAGGTVAGDTINGVVLGAGVNATGYLFAKANAAPLSADVSVTMTPSATNVALNSSVTLTITAANAGPGPATFTTVTDLLPAGISLLTAAATTGNYDAATGIWAVGVLNNGASATLALTGKVTSISAPIVNTATIASAVADPNVANNSASVTLNPDAGSLDVTQAIVRESRVLAFVGCGSGPGTGAACISDRANFLAGYLAGLGYDATVVVDPAAFVTGMRSGRYNAFWLSPYAGIADTFMQEVREAVFRGDTFVFDGPDGSTTDPLDEATGISIGRNTLGTNLALTIPGVTGTVATAGTARTLALQRGQTYATFAGSVNPAIVTNDYGLGRGVVTSFDLVATLRIPASELALRALVTDTLGTRAPQVPAAFVGSSYVPVTTTIVNKSTDTTIEVIATLPAGTSLVDANPAPAATSATQATWRFALPANSTAMVDLGLRLPPASGALTLQTDVRKLQNSTSVLYGSYSFPLAISASDVFGPPLIASLQGLNLSKGQERNARDSAVQLLTSAQGDLAAGRDLAAILDLLSAGNALDGVTSIDPTPYEITTDKWLQEAEQRWYLGLPVCGSADAAPISASGADFAALVSGGGLEVCGGRRQNKLDWAWSLGAVPDNPKFAAQQNLDWISGKTYGWTLTYNGAGQGTYTVSDGATQLFARTYSVAAQPLAAGNMLEFHMAATVDAGPAKMEASVQSINGNPVNANFATPGNSQPFASTAYFYYPAMASGFQLAGTLRVTYTSPIQLRDWQLDFTVVSGNSSCQAVSP